MEATLSTYSQTMQPVAPAEPPATPTPDVPAPVVETPTPTPDTPVTPTPDPAATPMPEPVIEDNVSAFSLGTDIPPTPTPDTPVQPVAPTFNLDDEIKKIDRKELAAKIGITEFALEMSDYQTKGGKPADFLSARAIDYNSVSDEELMRQDINVKYPNFTPEEKSRIYNRKYGIDDNLSDDDKADKLLDLKADAHSIRVNKITEQQTFKLPDAIPVKNEKYEQWEQSQQQNQQLQQQIIDYYNGHVATKALNESKRVAINLGEGIAPFNFNIDRPELITKTFTDAESYQKLMLTNTGEPDVAKQQLVTLFAYNPQKFMQDIFNYGKTIANRGKVAEGQNAVKPAAVVPLNAAITPTYKTGTFQPGQ